MEIINEPYEDCIYEFTVVKQLDEDTYLFIEHDTDGFKAEQKAKEIGGIIIHNVRIAGKEKK